jgi:hypothetical protein
MRPWVGRSYLLSWALSGPQWGSRQRMRLLAQIQQAGVGTPSPINHRALAFFIPVLQEAVVTPVHGLRQVAGGGKPLPRSLSQLHLQLQDNWCPLHTLTTSTPAPEGRQEPKWAGSPKGERPGPQHFCGFCTPQCQAASGAPGLSPLTTIS